MENPKDTDTLTEKMEEEYLEFLDDGEHSGKYSSLVKAMIEDQKFRLIVDVNDLRKRFSHRADGLLSNSFEEHKFFQIALKKYVDSIDSDFAKKYLEFFIGFEGSLGRNHVTPRSLTSRYLGNLVCVEGIVTKCSMVNQKIVKSVHFCPATGKFLERLHTDLTSFDPFPAAGAFPTKDEDGNPYQTEFGLTIFKDHQTISIQEMPEKARPGQLPRSVDVILDNDLVDKCKPGDRVTIVGGFRCLPGKHGGYTSGIFRTVIIANNVISLTKEVSNEVSPDDVQKCKKLAKAHPNKNIVELLSKSLAPSIYGHEYVKKAILLLLLGGTEKVLLNGTRLRGDINILLIGDPSVAKSQLLRYVLFTAPRAIPTTGRGSSGVGLTAAVTADQETGDRRLEAGAMVLADRGVICIDEFDKMSDIDRTAIHEVMEQGRVTIAKAGIHATLNARCSVLAAANPVYGNYDPYKSPMDNIGLQDSLLSRFDLLFVLLDKSDPDIDHMISDHVVRMHRYRNPMEQDGDPLPLESNLDNLSTKNPDFVEHNVNVDIFEKYDPLLHGKSRSKTDKILTINFMRKYIHIAKMKKPELTKEASKLIAEEFSKLRSEEAESGYAKTQPITARCLETLIRLATAHAKARLSKKVTVDDAQSAIELLQYAIFKKVLEKEKRNKRMNNESDQEDEIEQVHQEPTGKKRTRRAQQDDQYEFHDEDDETEERPRSLRSQRQKPSEEKEAEVETMEVDTAPEDTVTVTLKRLEIFQKLLNKMLTEGRKDSVTFDEIEAFIKENKQNFPMSEIKALLQRMSDENKIMIVGGNEVIPI